MVFVELRRILASERSFELQTTEEAIGIAVICVSACLEIHMQNAMRWNWLKAGLKAGVCQAKKSTELLFVTGWETLRRTGTGSVWRDEGLTILQADFNTAAKRWLRLFSHSVVQL